LAGCIHALPYVTVVVHAVAALAVTSMASLPDASFS
jgi:hypothetical protein